MKFLLVAALLVLLSVAVDLSSGQDLGRGGVFNSPAAQQYWNRRLGKDGLNAARSAGKLQSQQNSRASAAFSSRSGSSRSLYVPTFRGTYASPSRYWPNRSRV